MGLGLNLAGADLSGSDFEAIPSGTYHCAVQDVQMKETKGGENAKLPKGTPMINLQFRVMGGEYDNRRVFRQLIIAPEKVGNKKYEHKAVMDRILGQFFKSLGYSEDEITSEGFDPEPEDIIGRELLVVVSQKQKYNAPEGVMDNEVKGFKALNATVASGSKLL
jgi:hypothetical protein